MSNKSCLAAAIKELASVGIHRPEIAHGRKHMQLRWTTPHGDRRVFAVPGTLSAWRSVENTRHDLRRILARDGMLETASPRPPPPRQLLERRLLRSSGGSGLGRTRALEQSDRRLISTVCVEYCAARPGDGLFDETLRELQRLLVPRWVRPPAAILLKKSAARHKQPSVVIIT